MCGIVGQWSESGVSRDSLRKMADSVRHRGPDDEGFYVNHTIGLGSRRLSIIDIEAGGQPISNEDESVWIVFNGEIYNYPALRQSLARQGHSFKTQSDTEVILHLYEEHGAQCVKHLRGMFAFAIWDQNEERLFLARDPLGQKQLYYVHGSSGFAFASEMKALLAAECVSPQMDPLAMHHFISLRCIPGDRTLFDGIRKLPSGHTLSLQRGEISIEPYWDLRYEPKSAAPEEEIAVQLRDLLLDTVQSHMLSDVPLGAFLSGGLDSTLIASIMCTLSDGPVKTFSIGVHDPSFNELPFARMVAQRYGTEHHEFVVEPDLIASLPEMMWHMEEPVDPFAFGVNSVARLASQHVKVALGGDGGDEIFAGYDRYLGNQLVDLYCLLPRQLRRHVVEPLIRRLPDDYSYNNRVQKLRWMVAMSDSTAGERYAQSASFLRFGHAHKEALYADALWRQLGGVDSSEELVRFFDADNATHPIDKMLYTDVRTRLPEHLLVVTDRMTMAHSLEGRSPYVDHKMVEFAATVPADLKLKGRRLKHIQRRVASEFLPEPLLHRRKQGFSFPLARWFRTELRQLTTDLLMNSRLLARGYFRREGVASFLEEHMSGRVDHNYRLWLLLNLELWHRMFIDGQSPDELATVLRDDANRVGGQRSDGDSSAGHRDLPSPSGSALAENKSQSLEEVISR